MKSVSSTPNRHELLLELVQNVREGIRRFLPERGKLPVREFKRLLDDSAQEAIIETLNRLGVSARLVSEEGDMTFGAGEYTIIADPVDGTTNLARGLCPSVVSISIGRMPTQSSVFAGIVAGVETDEIFFAEEGRGATLNGRPICPMESTGLEESLVSLDISKLGDISGVLPLLINSRHIRAEGCSAMSLCRVAAGIMDAHVDHRGLIRATDISAGLFILREAGAVYAVNGKLEGDFPLKRDTRVSLIAASDKRLLEEIQSLITN